MAPIAVQCSVGGCQYETPEAELELAAQFLRIHTDAAHVGPVGNVHQPVRPEKVRRPQLVVKEGFVTEEAFGYFEHAWKEYKTLAAVTTAVKQHLSSCLGEEVSTLCQVWSRRLRRSDWGGVDGGRKGDGGEDEEQVGDAAAVKKNIAGPRINQYRHTSRVCNQ